MNKKIKIPKGWYILRVGSIIKKGDKFYSEFDRKWVESDNHSPIWKWKVGSSNGYTYIRKMKG